MNNLKNIHATCVSVNGFGILLTGRSGSGKSDLALRLIGNKQATLIADDRVDLSVEDNQLKASVPEVLTGCLEVRGVGICHLPFCQESFVSLVVELTDSINVERMPENECFEFGGVSIPLIRLCAFEASVIDKIVIKLNAILEFNGKKL